MALDVDRVLLERASELYAAARDIGMRGLCLQHGVIRDDLGRFCDLLVIGDDEPGLDRGARPRPALEQAALDQQEIDAFAGSGHASLMRLGPARRAVGRHANANLERGQVVLSFSQPITRKSTNSRQQAPERFRGG